MNFKTTYIMFGFLGLVVVLLLVVLFWKPEPELARGSYILTSAHEKGSEVRSGDIKRLEIVRTQPVEQKLVFERKAGDKWELIEPAKVRIDSGAVEVLVRQLLDATRSEKDLSIDMKEAGLDPPVQVCTLKTGDDRSWTINIGNATPGEISAVVYATSSDHPKKPLPLNKNDLDHVFWDLTQLRSRDLLAESPSGVVYVRVQPKGKAAVVLETSGEGQWNFIKPPYGAAEYEGRQGAPGMPPTGITGVSGLIARLVGIRVASSEGAFDKKDPPKDSGFVEGNAKDAKYGVESADKAEWVFEIKQLPPGEKDPKKANSETLLIGNKIDDKGEFYYARLLGDQNLVKVSNQSLEALKKFYDNPSELRDRTLVKIEAPKKPEVLRVENSSGIMEFIRQPETAAEAWKMWRGEQPFNADEVAVMTLEGALLQKHNIKDFPEGKKDEELGLDKPQARVWIWSDLPEKPANEDLKPSVKFNGGALDIEFPKPQAKKPPLKDVKEAIELAFGKQDRDKKTVVVKRTRAGVSTIVTVDDAILQHVTGSSLAFMDKALPSFPPINMTKLVILKDGKTTEIARKDMMDANKGFVINAPEAMKGRTAEPSAVLMMMSQLANLRCERWYTLKASEQELKTLGLQPGNVQVSVFVKDKEKEPTVYIFGKETEDKKGIYGKMGKDDTVFVADAALLKTLDADLQDLSILEFKLDDVVAVKLTGWQDLVGEPVTREVLRKGPQEWVAKTPPGLVVNSNNLENLVKSLQRIRADKFLIHKTGPTAEQNLDVKKGALEIQLTLKDKKEPVTLLIGKLDNDKYFVTSNQVPGDVFTLPKSLFEEVKKASAFVGVVK